MATEIVKLESPCGRYCVYLEANYGSDRDDAVGYCQARLDGYTIDRWEFDTLDEQPDENNPDLSWLTSEYVELYGEVL